MEDNLIKVVICDDHSIFREGIKSALKNAEDIEVIGEADNGMMLLKLLKHTSPDVILLDINMPIMDGFATLPNIKKLYPNIKVIILSWNNDLTWVTSMMNLGANSYLTKDDDSENIINAIKTCHSREFYLNELTELGIKKNLGKAPVEIPITKFNQASETDVKSDPEDETSEEKGNSFGRSLMKGLVYAIIALTILAGLYYIYTQINGNLEAIKEFLPGSNQRNEF